MMPKAVKKLLTPSKSLELPDGYQRFDYKQGQNDNGVVLDNPKGLIKTLESSHRRDLYLYTHHEISFEDGVIKQTRSSPNWEGGIVTYATCKHLMRSYEKTSWLHTWIVGLCPASMDNCVLFCGVVWKEFACNYDLSDWLLRHHHSQAYRVKDADNNPRGDLYTPVGSLIRSKDKNDHNNFNEPPDHTRSLEYYKKSPGSTSEREDGKIPKWWRDIEYKNNQGNRPKSFILNPCFLFSRPSLYTSYQPKRASLKLHPPTFAESLEM